MKSGATRAKRWISLGMLLVMVLSFAVPALALPSVWYKKIYVTKNPSKMVYEIGESFDPAGMKMGGDVYDSSGNFLYSTSPGLKDLKFSPSKFTKSGKQKVKLQLHVMSKSGSYDWLSTEITVTVNPSGDGPTEYYTDIFVAAQPKKTIYTVGESFKTSGLSISAHYYSEEDGKKHTRTKMSQKNMKISPTKFTKAGKQKVKLSLSLVSKSGENKWFSTTVEVLVEKGDVKITKHPTGETVNEGGSCGFIARANYADSCHWFFSKGGSVVDASNASTYFPGLTITGVSKEHLKLKHIPASMNGWSAYCIFYGDDSSATSNKAGIVVLADPTTIVTEPDPTEEVPVEITPKAIETTPKAETIQTVTEAPAVSEAPATPTPAAASKPAAASAYAEGIHCTINGQTRVPIDGDTVLKCVADDIEGFVFDHWEINGVPDYEAGASVSLIASDAAVIQAYYHERKVLRTVNCFLQLLTKNNNASGTKYTEFDFEDTFFNPVTNTYCPAGLLDCYVTAVIPRNAKVDYWLINGVKYQFPDNKISKFRILGLNEATTIEPVFKGMSPVEKEPRPAVAEELVYQEPHKLTCINCWAQFLNVANKAAGSKYEEFDFDRNYTNPVTRKKQVGGLLDNIQVATSLPRGCTVESWYINDVAYQFPGTVLHFQVFNLQEATVYEVRYKGVRSDGPSPTPFHQIIWEWAQPIPEIN